MGLGVVAEPCPYRPSDHREQPAPHQRHHHHRRSAGRPGASLALARDAERGPAVHGARLGVPGPAGTRPGARHGGARPGGDGVPRPERDHPPQAQRRRPLPRAQPPGPAAGGRERAGAAGRRWLARHQYRCGGFLRAAAGRGCRALARPAGPGARLRRQRPGRGGGPGGAGLRQHCGGRPRPDPAGGAHRRLPELGPAAAGAELARRQ